MFKRLVVRAVGFCLAGLASIAASVQKADGSTPFVPNDPFFFTGTPAGFPGQWHLDKQTSGASIDANVRGAWDRGLTGEGVVIGIVDDGISLLSHPDLSPNARADLRWDFATNAPPLAGGSHGTAVAGVAAARGGNGIGTTGVAPSASLAALHITTYVPIFNYLYSESLDAQYAAATLWQGVDGEGGIDIKNHSYSATFNYYGAYIPFPLAEAATKASTLDGVIHVRAAMNGREFHGTTYTIVPYSPGGTSVHAARDGNASKFALNNIPETIVVSAVNAQGKFSSYSSYGANVFVAAPSADGGPGYSITTTDPIGEFGYNNSSGDAQYHPSYGEDLFPDLDYTSTFSGTSSATPVVSGVLALAKEVQPAINTRFAKHLLAKTSRLIDPTDSTPMGGWGTNNAGYHFNNNYGFGLIDADALTRAATEYSGVTSLTQISTGNTLVNQIVPNNDAVGISHSFLIADGGPLEEVVVHLSVASSYDPGGNFSRGDVEATLVSPSGASSLLMYRNPLDFWEGSLDWSFTSNAFWGEAPVGEWTLTVRDVNAGNDADQDARDTFWQSFSVTLRSGSLIPAGLGDFNADGVVDAADYMKWRDNFGSTINLSADDSGNGIVDAADYVIWRSHLGMGSATSVVMVPEPRMALSLLMVSLGFCRRRKQTVSS